MRSPEGEEFPNAGCYLEVIEGERLVWTDALEPGYRPTRRAAADAAGGGISAFTAVISLASHGEATNTPPWRYTKPKRRRRATKPWVSMTAGGRHWISSWSWFSRSSGS